MTAPGNDVPDADRAEQEAPLDPSDVSLAGDATPPVDGAFAEYVTIQADFAYDIPDSVSDEAAALIEPLSVGLWACERAGIKPGSRVLIAGAGPTGLMLGAELTLAGVDVVIIERRVNKERIQPGALEAHAGDLPILSEDLDRTVPEVHVQAALDRAALAVRRLLAGGLATLLLLEPAHEGLDDLVGALVRLDGLPLGLGDLLEVTGVHDDLQTLGVGELARLD